MNSKLKAYSKLPVISILSLMLLISISYAQGLGVLKGQVSAENTGKSLPMVNVWLIGTDIDTETDINGSFSFTELPTGCYQVSFSPLIGTFSAKTSEEVIVSDGKTTEMKMSLKPKLQSLSISYSRKNFNAERLKPLELSVLRNIALITPGFKLDAEGNLHFRGSRAGETSVILNGVDQRDPQVVTQEWLLLNEVIVSDNK